MGAPVDGAPGEDAAPSAADSVTERRHRRRDPIERKVSSRTAFLLLITIVEAAFGYAFLGPAAAAADLRLTHALIGVGLIVLAAATLRAIGGLDPSTMRTRLMRGTLIVYLVIGVLQGITGAALRWSSLGATVPLAMFHLGPGLTLPFLALVAHMAAVQPSLRLGAEREHQRSLAALETGRDRRPPDGA